MDAKLTLKLDNDVIQRSKKYAAERKTSLSKMFENYMNSVTKHDVEEKKITPLVESLTGIIPHQNEKNVSDDRYEYLKEKYS